MTAMTITYPRTEYRGDPAEHPDWHDVHIDGQYVGSYSKSPADSPLMDAMDSGDHPRLPLRRRDGRRPGPVPRLHRATAARPNRELRERPGLP